MNLRIFVSSLRGGQEAGSKVEMVWPCTKVRCGCSREEVQEVGYSRYKEG